MCGRPDPSSLSKGSGLARLICNEDNDFYGTRIAQLVKSFLCMIGKNEHMKLQKYLKKTKLNTGTVNSEDFVLIMFCFSL